MENAPQQDPSEVLKNLISNSCMASILCDEVAHEIAELAVKGQVPSATLVQKYVERKKEATETEEVERAYRRGMGQ